MTRRELDRVLLKAGWRIEHGRSHDLAISLNGQIIALPRHKGDLKTGTVNQILRLADLR